MDEHPRENQMKFSVFDWMFAQRKTKFVYLSLLVLVNLSNVGCGKKSGGSTLVETISTVQSNSGKILITSSGTSIVSLYDSTGTFEKVLRDLNNPVEVPYGVAWSPLGYALAAVDGLDRVEKYDIDENTVSTHINNSNLTASPIQGMTVDASGNVYVVESNGNTIEKFSPSGARQGNPFIAATVGTCVLSTPRNIVALSNGNIAVTSAANNRLLIYNSSGGCVASITTAPFGSNAPYALGFDALHSKIIVGFNTNSAIVSTNIDGSGATQIYLNTSIILNPTAIAVTSLGEILVTGTGLNTVEKLTYTGSGTATRTNNVPFISPSAYVRTIYGIAVIP